MYKTRKTNKLCSDKNTTLKNKLTDSSEHCRKQQSKHNKRHVKHVIVLDQWNTKKHENDWVSGWTNVQKLLLLKNKKGNYDKFLKCTSFSNFILKLISIILWNHFRQKEILINIIIYSLSNHCLNILRL